MYKILILFLTFLTGCYSSVTKLEFGHCYFNNNQSSAIKVVNVEKYGAFIKVVYLNSPNQRDGYVSWYVLEQDPYLFHEIDCDEYERVRTN